ncbi:MAG: isochorismatase family protein [Candidatus Thorarchaeota archaeon]
MRKEKYLTIENSSQKISQWQHILTNYYSSKKKFQFHLEKSALLIIDMQDYFLNPLSHAYLPSAEAIIDPIIKLQNFFQKNNRPIFFTQFGNNQIEKNSDMMFRWWNGNLYFNDPFYAISSQFDTSEATIIHKSTYDSFIGTNLLNLLNEKNITSIVITGVTTHLCCESTARSAFGFNKEVYLPIDCMATFTEELHLNALKSASHGFGIPVKSQELLE